jgi:hypothetical protein
MYCTVNSPAKRRDGHYAPSGYMTFEAEPFRQ